MTVAERKPSRKRLTVAAKQIKDVEEGEFVRLKRHRGVGRADLIQDDWARVSWLSGERTGGKSDHPLAALRRVRGVGSDFDHRGGTR